MPSMCMLTSRASVASHELSTEQRDLADVPAVDRRLIGEARRGEVGLNDATSRRTWNGEGRCRREEAWAWVVMRRQQRRTRFMEAATHGARDLFDSRL